MNRLTLLASALALATLGASTFARDAQPANPNPMVRTVRLSVTDPRPIAAAIIEIEQRHGVAISYEDIPYAHAGDTQDVAQQVRRDLNQFPAGQAPAALIPRNGTVDFAYEADRTTGEPVSLDATLAALFDAHAAAGNAGAFRVVGGAGMTHVVPAFAKDATGADAPAHAVLDTVIATGAISANGIDVLTALCDALSRQSGELVVVGTIPANLFGNARVALPAMQGEARATLGALLAQVPAKCSWQLFHDPGLKFYALNIHTID